MDSEQQSSLPTKRTMQQSVIEYKLWRQRNHNSYYVCCALINKPKQDITTLVWYRSGPLRERCLFMHLAINTVWE